jgi:hypothetical protein
MPSPFLRALPGTPPEFECSLCKTKFFHPRVWNENTAAEEKTALLKEWDEHLYSTHRRQWEREQKKNARRMADRERIMPNH